MKTEQQRLTEVRAENAEAYIEALLRACGPVTFTRVTAELLRQQPGVNTQVDAINAAHGGLKNLQRAERIVVDKAGQDTSYDWAYSPKK